MTTGIQQLIEAAEDFVAKVDRGEARSVRSYRKFKDALDRIKIDGSAIIEPHYTNCFCDASCIGNECKEKE